MNEANVRKSHLEIDKLYFWTPRHGSCPTNQKLFIVNRYIEI